MEWCLYQGNVSQGPGNAVALTVMNEMLHLLAGGRIDWCISLGVYLKRLPYSNVITDILRKSSLAVNLLIRENNQKGWGWGEIFVRLKNYRASSFCTDNITYPSPLKSQIVRPLCFMAITVLLLFIAVYYIPEIPHSYMNCTGLPDILFCFCIEQGSSRSTS